MLTLTRHSLLLFSFLLLSCTTARETSFQDSYGDVHEEVSEIILKMPVSTPVEQTWLNQQLAETGPEGIRVLAGMLTRPGTGNDTYARYALSSLATHTSRPGAEPERAEFENSVLDELQQRHSSAAKAFLIRQLELTGSDQSVPVVAEFLAHERLFGPAINHLVTLDTPESVRAVREFLQHAEDDRRIATIKALAELQDREAAAEIRTFTSSEEWPLKRISLYALANIGDPEAVDLFEEALESPDASEAARETDLLSFYLIFADRLAEEGHQAQSDKINRRILDGSYPDNMRSSALSSLFRSEGDQMLDELLDLSVSAGPVVRDVALSLVNGMEGGRVTEALAATLDIAPEERQAEIITALGNRGGTSALQTVSPYIGSSSARVRIAAAESLFQLGASSQMTEIVEALNQASDEGEVRSMETILLQMPTEELVNASAEALPAAAEPARPALIRILASRRAADHLPMITGHSDHENKDVRLEVYQALQLMGGPEDLDLLTGAYSADYSHDETEAVQAAIAAIINRTETAEDRNAIAGRLLNQSSDSQKPMILQTLPRIEGVYAAHASGELDSSDGNIRNAAVLALAEWRDPTALPDLLDAAAVASDSVRPEIYQGYVRLINSSAYSAEEKAKLLHNLAETADSSQQKAEIIQTFSRSEDIVALQAAGRFFTSDNNEVSEQAFRVASGVLASSYGEWGSAYRLDDPSESGYGSGSGISSSSNAVLAVLGQTERSRLLEALEKQAAEAAEVRDSDVEESVEPEPVYGRVFNGQNLDGWQAIGQDPGSWGVEDGMLHTDGEGSGWLSTNAQYEDFIIELEFRVPEGGNSGVFIRAPHEGNPAYAGMEIQILDDYADRYSDLQPYQYSGSIYNIKAPSKQVSLPAGEWQRMMIRADGPDIQVTLNGELIVNTSLVNHMELVDDHPGLVRRSGHIGLQNYSSSQAIFFRNIYIHEID